MKTCKFCNAELPEGTTVCPSCGKDNAEKQTLSAQLEQQQRENDSLSSALEKADDPEYLQELAREQLDMVSPGEKVFYDVSN